MLESRRDHRNIAMIPVDFGSIRDIGKSPEGVAWVVIINWMVRYANNRKHPDLATDATP